MRALVAHYRCSSIEDRMLVRAGVTRTGKLFVFELVPGTVPDWTTTRPDEVVAMLVFSPALQAAYAVGDVVPVTFGPKLETTCPECRGHGWHVGDHHPREVCGKCDGVGKVQ